MLSLGVINKWLELRGEDGVINEHWVASLAQRHPDVAEAYEQGFLIEELLTAASIAKNRLSTEQFALDLRERLEKETDSPEAAQAIWDAALP